ncbi:hypothetical protein CPLU01_12493 [Colletotrichum plurivorum]|uniref:Uncharacterized protein n=1 Tax=Colletotrichum plurivorum TaxID=2175906 RepID=A0A8H6N6J3_9PEZI|nr:hypothetical protein CPLU01_12493 [Colletotrichum plurivorum]
MTKPRAPASVTQPPRATHGRQTPRATGHRSSYVKATSPASCFLALPPQPRQSSNDKRTHVFTASSSSPRPLTTSGSSKQTTVAVSTAKGFSEWHRANKRQPLLLSPSTSTAAQKAPVRSNPVESPNLLPMTGPWLSRLWPGEVHRRGKIHTKQRIAESETLPGGFGEGPQQVLYTNMGGAGSGRGSLASWPGTDSANIRQSRRCLLSLSARSPESFGWDGGHDRGHHHHHHNHHPPLRHVTKTVARQRRVVPCNQCAIPALG